MLKPWEWTPQTEVAQRVQTRVTSSERDTQGRVFSLGLQHTRSHFRLVSQVLTWPEIDAQKHKVN